MAWWVQGPKAGPVPYKTRKQAKRVARQVEGARVQRQPGGMHKKGKSSSGCVVLALMFVLIPIGFIAAAVSIVV